MEVQDLIHKKKCGQKPGNIIVNINNYICLLYFQYLFYKKYFKKLDKDHL